MNSSDSEDSDKGIRYKTESTRCDEKLKDQLSFGPTLPPHLKNDSLEGSTSSSNENLNDTSQIIGPALPPHLCNNFSINSELDTKVIGPTLPPYFQKPSNSIGPPLPDEFQQKLENEDEAEDDVYGPLPVGANRSRAHLELEERALQMKIDMLNPDGDKEPAREEWMLELPAVKAASFGLGPRQFRAKEAPDLSDRSTWTETPQDKAKKRESKNKQPPDVKKEAEIIETKKRDKEQEFIAKKHKRNKESLVESHMKKIKKKDDSSTSSERRPFSREVDLQVNRFDEAQKKAVLKKAQLLDTRFSSGESKFL